MCVIRFIKDVLDVKNILGSRGAQPDPPFDPYEFFMYTNDGDFNYTPIFTGTLLVSEPFHSVVHLDSSQSGVQQTTHQGSQVAQVSLHGDLTNLILPSNAPVQMIVANNSVRTITLNDDVSEIDLRNAEQLQSISVYGLGPRYVDLLYAIANTTQQRDACVNLIVRSLATDCVLWIDATQAYAADVIAAASGQNWEINYL